MILLCDCCHSEFVSEDFIIGGEQLCPACFKAFIIDPQIEELENDEEFFPIDDYTSKIHREE